MRLSSLLLPLRNVSPAAATLYVYALAAGALLMAPGLRETFSQTAPVPQEKAAAKTARLTPLLPALSSHEFEARFNGGFDAIFVKNVPDNIENARENTTPKSIPIGKSNRQVFLQLEDIRKISFPQEV